MWTVAFWKASFERGIKSAAQTLALLWAVDGGMNILDVSWAQSFGMAGGAYILSVATSLASSAVGDNTSPSLVSKD
jgi:hypothetical protein